MMKMKRIELTVVFHLYSIDPQFMIPATHEYGEDIEFNNNTRGNLWHQVTKMIFYHFPEFHYDKDDSTFGCHLIRSTFYNEDETVQFMINFLTDSHPWPQIDVDLCKERKTKADNGELGQTWWIHHLDLPDGRTVNWTGDMCCREAEEAIVESIHNGIQTFLDSLK